MTVILSAGVPHGSTAGVGTNTRPWRDEGASGSSHDRAAVDYTAGRVWLLSVVALAAVDCNASIQKFDVSPRHSVCPGTPVAIVWDVTGSPKLTVSPNVAGAPNGKVAASGRATFAATGKTVVSLRVSRWFGEPTGADFDVNPPAPAEVAVQLADTSTCSNGILTMKAHTGAFDANAVARAVNSPRRSIELSRDGKATAPIAIPRGGTTMAFAALSANGDWTVSTMLEPGETCRNPPNGLTFVIYTACEGDSR